MDECKPLVDGAAATASGLRRSRSDDVSDVIERIKRPTETTLDGDASYINLDTDSGGDAIDPEEADDAEVGGIENKH